jgi:hypothetical protein
LAGVNGCGLSQPISLVDDSEDDVFFMRRALKEVSITNPLFVGGDEPTAIDYLSGTAQFSGRGKYPMPHPVRRERFLAFCSQITEER